MTDLIGLKSGYGLGGYAIYPADSSIFFGDDFSEILKYFKKKREGALFNRKSDISPGALKEYLPWVSLVEPVWDEAGKIVDGIVTLHGSAVAAAYSDGTGKSVIQVHHPHVAERVIRSMQQAAEIGGGVVGISEERQLEPPHVRVNILYLPISSDGETLSHFFSYVRLDPLD